MIFKNQYDISFWPKSVFCACILATVFTSIWLMFADTAHSATWLKPYLISGDLFRRVLIALCLIIYFLRLQVTVWVFQKRKWVWPETIIIAILVPLALYAFAHVGGNNHQPFSALEIVGGLLYILGSYINTDSEYRRHVWKLKEENKGRLYTARLFKYSVHINYFGDIVLFTGFAMITHSLSMLVIPLIMTANFVFNIIPSLDRYLEKNYGDEFRDYSQKTKKLIPWIY
jgi:protein-S-isoprenylcysteine O-methyltransferase Ste14